jgi:ectoine hydroxylase-related dioxygenase (phytanoyl-CoA dioxygenase family)
VLICTNFFVKEPVAKEIPWHQDFNYWPLEPPIIVSAWIAIDPSTVVVAFKSSRVLIAE